MDTSAAGAPDLSGLIELSRDPQLDLKPVILRVQTDLFLAAPVRDREALEAFESLSTGLIPTVDDDTVALVAQKLAPFAETPDGVLVALASRGGESGKTVLAFAPNLTQPMVEAALLAGVDVEAAIDLRAAHLRAQAADNEAADQALARNPEVRINHATLNRLIHRARTDQALAGVLLARPDLAPRDLAPLWLHADAHQRGKIEEAVAATAGLRSIPPASRTIGAALKALSSGGDVRGFAAALADELGLAATFLTSAPDPASRYDLLTLALRAADLREEDAIHIFLTLNDVVACSVERVFALVALFRTTTRPTARELIAAILDVTLGERSGTADHLPYHGEDAARPRSTAVERIFTRVAEPNRQRRKG